jgi:hypothetical protein
MNAQRQDAHRQHRLQENLASIQGPVVIHLRRLRQAQFKVFTLPRATSQKKSGGTTLESAPRSANLGAPSARRLSQWANSSPIFVPALHLSKQGQRAFQVAAGLEHQRQGRGEAGQMRFLKTGHNPPRIFAPARHGQHGQEGGQHQIRAGTDGMKHARQESHRPGLSLAAEGRVTQRRAQVG